MERVVLVVHHHELRLCAESVAVETCGVVVSDEILGDSVVSVECRVCDVHILCTSGLERYEGLVVNSFCSELEDRVVYGKVDKTYLDIVVVEY